MPFSGITKKQVLETLVLSDTGHYPRENMRNVFRLQSVMAIFCIVIQCKNPFLPPVGDPVEERITGQRSTPQGVVDQLIESYETLSIALFRDLMPDDGSFRFFIAPDYFDDYVISMHGETLFESRDERLQFIGQSEYYYYWTQASEIERHTRLFSQIDRIEFVSRPGLESVREFEYGGDTLAELLVTGGAFMNFRSLPGDTVEQYSVSIDRQVFLLGKDAEKLWIIRKWYDFSHGS